MNPTFFFSSSFISLNFDWSFSCSIYHLFFCSVCVSSSYSVSVAEPCVWISMASASAVPERKNKKKVTEFPPRRGQVKAQILKSIAKTVASAASKAREAMAKNKGEGSDGKSSSSGTSTPPQSAYVSEGNGHMS
ncbi:hypothetical protein HRI_002877000 [Hibiscus trionum]|uniref:Uncharacterized protein n=1 Tax=Hibiscus trionum TaxID=183268 RepID=A0A9W7IB77_HIBTR|nr:hypothetical protein HRI_002877000 [Hibiscus trionum]